MTASPSALLDRLGVGSGGTSDWVASAPRMVNETKLSIVTVMRALERPTTPEELRVIWGKRKPLKVFDYHLSTLVRAEAAEFVSDGPVLRFRLIGRAGLPLQSHIYREWCR